VLISERSTPWEISDETRKKYRAYEILVNAHTEIETYTSLWVHVKAITTKALEILRSYASCTPEFVHAKVQFKTKKRQKTILIILHTTKALIPHQRGPLQALPRKDLNRPSAANRTRPA